MTERLGRVDLPPEAAAALRRAIRLEWVTVVAVLAAVGLLYTVMGQSQAMRAALVEDALALVPPVAFLVSVRVARRPPDPAHPYGHHRAVAIGHLVAGTALASMGLLLVWDSASGLLAGEHPGIGVQLLWGHQVWAGWLMVAALAATAVAPLLLGRAKMPLVRELDDRVLFADADMNRADWRTSLAGVVGVLGIGMGLWWADAAAALFIAASIVADGFRNVRGALVTLMDARVAAYDNDRPHPLLEQVTDLVERTGWVERHRVRMREEGYVFHVEVFAVPRGGRVPPWAEVRRTREAVAALDWKLADVVLVVLDELPEHVPAPR